MAAGDPEGAGRRLATVIVGLLHDSERIALLTAFIRAAATGPEVAAIVRDIVTGQVLEPLVADTTLVEALAGTLQRYLTGDIQAAPGPSAS